jgi:uncharacterized protein
MKFIADSMLGKLAKLLRMMGYDTVYYRGNDRRQLLTMARQEDRVILTRSMNLLPGNSEDRILKLTEDHPLLQIKELLQSGSIKIEEEKSFSRCLLCNRPLERISKEDAEGKVPDFVFYQQEDFFQCPACLRIYWPGSHLENMQKRMEDLHAALPPKK